MSELDKPEIVLPELSYKIIGSAFDVFNNLGWGWSEKTYGKALAKELTNRKINFRQEVYIPLRYENKNLNRYFADFIAENKILLELKVVHKLGYVHARQTLQYLQGTGIKLGILIYFTKDGVKYRRILNPNA